MKIIRASDQIEIKIHNIFIIIQPLTYGKRLEMSKFITINDGKEQQNYAESMMFLVKNTVKSIRVDEEVLDLDFKDGQMTEESLTDVMGILEGNAEAYKNIALLSSCAGKKIPKILDPITGASIEGVEISILPKK